MLAIITTRALHADPEGLLTRGLNVHTESESTVS